MSYVYGTTALGPHKRDYDFDRCSFFSAVFGFVGFLASSLLLVCHPYRGLGSKNCTALPFACFPKLIHKKLAAAAEVVLGCSDQAPLVVVSESTQRLPGFPRFFPTLKEQRMTTKQRSHPQVFGKS